MVLLFVFLVCCVGVERIVAFLSHVKEPRTWMGKETGDKGGVRQRTSHYSLDAREMRGKCCFSEVNLSLFSALNHLKAPG